MSRDISQATTYVDKVRPASAVSRWSMDNSDLESGTIKDSWSSNDGTLNGGVTTGVSGVGGSEAFSFDGSDDYVDTGFSPTYPCTISFWMRTTSDVTQAPLTGVQTTGTSNNGHVEVYDGKVQISDPRASSSTYVSTNYSKNTWDHYVAIFRSIGDFELFKNGVKSSGGYIGDEIEVHESDNLLIGARYANSGPNSYIFQGDLDEVRVYSEVLSQQQIWKLYNIGRNANWGFSRS